MSCRGPIAGLAGLLALTGIATPTLIHRTVEKDLRKSVQQWLAEEPLTPDVVIQKVDGQDVLLSGPASQMNPATETVLRKRSSNHWVEQVGYNPTADPPAAATIAAAPTTIAAAPTTIAAAPTTKAAPATTKATAAPIATVAQTAPPSPQAPPSSNALRSSCGSMPTVRGAFDPSSTSLNSSALSTLDQIALLMKGTQTCHLEIEAHTDSRGDEASNEELSVQRAEAVKAYLVNRGVNADSLTAKGYGESKPVVSPESTDEDRKTNSRIEFTPSGN